MKGMRPFTDEEITAISDGFTGTYANRDRALFITGVKSGFRISELLSLKVEDVYDRGRIVDRVSVAKRHTKKQIESRSVPLHPLAKGAILVWLQDMKDMGKFSPDAPLFPSRKGDKSITRVAAYQRINKAADYVGISIKDIGTHSMRKTFADRVYERSNHNLIQTQQALGHKNVTSTTSYLSFRQEDIDDLILSS